MRDEPRLKTPEVVRVAAFRAALRSFLGNSDRLARASGLTPGDDDPSRPSDPTADAE